MTQPGGNGTAAKRSTTPSNHNVERSSQKPLERLAERLTDPADRVAFAKLVSWADSIPPDDEVAKMVELLGFITLIGRDLPDAIAQERQQLRDVLAKAYTALQQEIKTNASYHEQLQQRLAQLPGEIAQGVRPEDIAKAMSESFRQQIGAAGLQEATVLLSSVTTDLKTATGKLDQAVKPISERYGNIAGAIEARALQIERESNRLANSAATLNRQNEELLEKVRRMDWYVYALIAVFLIGFGFWAGMSWEQWQFADVASGIQDQITTLQQSVKALQPPPAPLKPQKGKGGGNPRGH